MDILLIATLGNLYKYVTKLNIYKNNTKQRNVSKIFNTYIPKTDKTKKFYLYKYLTNYNSLDSYITKKTPKQFKIEMKSIYLYNPVFDSHD